MYLVKSTRDYEKSYKKLEKSGKNKNVIDELNGVVNLLANGNKLDRKHRDHQLIGELFNYRECHIKPDLLLIYRIYNNELILILFSLGSRSELFGK